jgi:hypothetical protein
VERRTRQWQTRTAASEECSSIRRDTSNRVRALVHGAGTHFGAGAMLTECVCKKTFFWLSVRVVVEMTKGPPPHEAMATVSPTTHVQLTFRCAQCRLNKNQQQTTVLSKRSLKPNLCNMIVEKHYPQTPKHLPPHAARYTNLTTATMKPVRRAICMEMSSV